jgi:3-deoxy-D-manno-octulosonic-acid transferase
LISFFYFLSIKLYQFGVGVTSLFLPKAKAWIDGRRNWEHNLRSQLATFKSKPIWFHCASYGEYLQALPLIKELHKNYSDPIVLSFFSPSGYKNFSARKEIQTTFYLPIDSKVNARKLIEIIQPKMYIGVKYDIWPNLQNELSNHKTPQVLIAAQFRHSQIYFKPWGKFFKKALSAFHPIFTQYPSGKKVLDSHKIDNILVGDPRFDQAIENSQTSYSNSAIEAFLGGKKAVIFGSAWKEEIEVAAKFHSQHPEEKIIIAPHEIGASHLTSILSSLSNKYGFLSKNEIDSNILIIDSVGTLRYLYRYGKIALVAGGFTGKLHNIIEPMAYGLPIIIGSNHHRFPEAEYAINKGSAISCASIQEMSTQLSRIVNSDTTLTKMSNSSQSCTVEKNGATNAILNHPIFAKYLTKQ